MVKKNLVEWLDWIKNLHFKEIDLGLERVSEVARRLRLLNPNAVIVTVGGTNGKGSTVAGLEAIYLAAGKRVGAFTTPFLFCYNEQVRILGKPALDEDFCDAFIKVAAACEELTLTAFEFGTLAALVMFKEANLDIWLLEVGLGGRYDAVNILDADLSIVTSISIDHAELLGHTREAIGYQKAGIFRADKPAICGDFDPPQSVLTEKVKKLYCQTKQFSYESTSEGWNWWCEQKRYEHLPQPVLALQNMSTVLMAIEVLQEKLPVNLIAIQQGLKNVMLPGRLQVVPGRVQIIYDVSHNPASAQFLANFLQNNFCAGKTRAVFSMLGDKDIVETLNAVKKYVDTWDIAVLPIPRGATEAQLMQSFQKAGITSLRSHRSIEEAFESVERFAEAKDRIVVFGSFHTVAAVAKTKV